jgi:hypothetical protein
VDFRLVLGPFPRRQVREGFPTDGGSLFQPVSGGRPTRARTQRFCALAHSRDCVRCQHRAEVAGPVHELSSEDFD